MTSSVPWVSWSSTKTTLRQKGPESMTGVATSSLPPNASMSSIMPRPRTMWEPVRCGL
jgi:hypothetical protein